MNSLGQYIGKQVQIEVSGKFISGVLVDYGSDIIIIFNGQQFLYLPLNHLQYIKEVERHDPDLSLPSEAPIDNNAEQISFRKVLNNAKGLFVEIFVNGNQSIHGYLTSILNDYFVFYSPVYKTIFISLNHVKWLIPYSPNLTPYSLSKQHLPVNPTNISLARTFEQQLKKLEGALVVFDLGVTPNKIGLLQKLENNTIELIMSNGEQIYWNVEHLKSVHLP